jgi:hypothetical protein
MRTPSDATAPVNRAEQAREVALGKALAPQGCDQEVRKRTLVASHKVHEEVSKPEIRNDFEPCDVQVSLPRRADE